MAKSALFIGWSRAVPGREAHALELWTSSMAYLGKLQAAGKVDSFEPVLLRAHGGDLNGFVLVRGDHDKLDALQHAEDWRELQMKSAVVMQGYGVTSAVIGEELTNEFTRWGKFISTVK